MKDKKFLKAFIEDCKYYDLENKEINEIIKSVNVKNKTILDIGAGIGRLAFPLSKYAKEVVALDKDKRFIEYFQQHKKKNLTLINKSLENYKTNKKFDIILTAWPTLNFKSIDLIKKVMHDKSKFILITGSDDSDLKKTFRKIKKNKNHEKYVKNRENLIKNLTKNFKVKIKKKMNVYYTFPNKKIAFKLTKNSAKLWYSVEMNEKAEKIILSLLKKREKGKKIILKEKVWFILMENLKCKS